MGAETVVEAEWYQSRAPYIQASRSDALMRVLSHINRYSPPSCLPSREWKCDFHSLLGFWRYHHERVACPSSLLAEAREQGRVWRYSEVSGGQQIISLVWTLGGESVWFAPAVSEYQWFGGESVWFAPVDAGDIAVSARRQQSKAAKCPFLICYGHENAPICAQSGGKMRNGHENALFHARFGFRSPNGVGDDISSLPAWPAIYIISQILEQRQQQQQQ